MSVVAKKKCSRITAPESFTWVICHTEGNSGHTHPYQGRGPLLFSFPLFLHDSISFTLVNHLLGRKIPNWWMLHVKWNHKRQCKINSNCWFKRLFFFLMKNTLKHTKKSPTAVQNLQLFFINFLKSLTETLKALIIFFRSFP